MDKDEDDGDSDRDVFFPPTALLPFPQKELNPSSNLGKRIKS